MSAIVIAQEIGGPDHFAGVDEALRARGAEAAWTELAAPARLGPATRVVAVSDARTFAPYGLLREARSAGACTVLLMDRAAGHRDIFLGRRDRFLRPAPVDVVACAGRADEKQLRALGNDAVATGLPRLDAVRPLRPASGARAVLVVTGPLFGECERRCMAEALAALRGCFETLGVRARWRVAAGLELDLGADLDRAPLHESMAACRAVISADPTELIRAMKSGRPAALLHPFDTPCWPVAAWMVDRDAAASPAALRDAVGSLLEPSRRQRARQREALAAMHQGGRPAADAVAELLIELAERPRRRERPLRTLDPTRLPARLPAAPLRPRVLSIVRCDASPVGGVTTWSKRLARACAERGQYDVRTLLVTTHPDAIGWADDDPELTRLCVVDPTADHWRAVQTVRAAIERLEPAIVLPNYGDLCFAAAMQLRPHGVRTIAIAHTDHASCRDVIAHYDRWDGAAGVSDACMAWLAPIAGDRPAARIVYGVPVAPAPRRVEPRGPLKLAYVGRMVESQKRISDLLALIDALEARAVASEFHVIGDGQDFDGWRRALARRRLKGVHVIVHGRRPAEWVERFLGGIDASVLVSDYEGTSITMLEAMGAGVVPVVTRVSSGVDEWVRDGENGIAVPVGATGEMAGRLADLAGDRRRLARMGRAAWETVRGEIGLDVMARRYGDLFAEVLARPMDRRPTDLGVRLCDHYTWSKEWVDAPDKALGWIRARLREAGFGRIALDEPADGGDAVIVRAGCGDDVEARVRALRAGGLGVAVWPHLIEAPATDRLHRAVRRAVGAGCRRLAIYGVGRHTRRTAAIFDRGIPFVGLIDDDPPRPRVFGLPVVPLARAMTELKPDAILLSSDACEERLWRNCAALRDAGVRVLALYGTYDEEAPVSASLPGRGREATLAPPRPTSRPR